MFNTVLLMGALTGIFLAIGLVLGGAPGMAVMLVLSIAINFISFWFSDSIVLRMQNAKPSQNAKLKEMVAALAKEAKIPVPRVYEVDQSVPNAFATGRDSRHCAVAVTKGLMALDDEEMEGVLAHEISHIKHHDTLVSVIAAAIGGAIAYVAQLGYYGMLSNSGNRENNGGIGIILVAVFAPLAAILIRLAISRGREFDADKSGALLTKKPRALASALRKISEIGERNPIRGSPATGSLWIVNPFRADWFSGLFSTHPPIQKRIERLEEMAGG
jgi:heat shock protein HtpX